MSRSRLLTVVLVAIMLAGACASAASSARGSLTARPAGAYHPIPNAYAGFNAPFWGNSWQALSPALRQAAADLGPGALRVFGGSTANYWNWRTGLFYDKPGVPRGLRAASHTMTPIHLSDWADLLRHTNTHPVFDLNVVSSTLSDQLAMLRAARDLGMPIRRIELGNEIYLDTRVFVRRFPTAQAYGRTATRWIRAIKRNFPQAQVAAVGRASHGSRHKRQRGWKRTLLKTLRGEDAITLHSYWTSSPRRLGRKALADIFAAPIRRVADLHRKGIRQLPRRVEAWLTEWTVRPNRVMRGTWAHGLSDAEYVVGVLAERRVRQQDLHALVLRAPGGALFANAQGFGGKPSTVRFARTAVGAAFGELYPLISGGPRVRRVAVRHAPRLRGTRLSAIRAVGVKRRGALLLNLTGRRHRVRLAAGPACGETLDSVWARPSARITGQPGELNRQTRQTEGSLSLPPYSVNRLSC
jgi:hypothetical protein